MKEINEMAEKMEVLAMVMIKMAVMWGTGGLVLLFISAALKEVVGKGFSDIIKALIGF